MTDTSRPTKIVVGVNGSPSSRSALAWALRQTRLTDGVLHTVISTWTIPVNHGRTPVPDRSEGSPWPTLARNVLDKAIEEAVGSTGTDHIRRHVVEGYPVRELLAAASDADLLVVGSGGNRSADAPLSSLCEDLVRRAPCPVVVVGGRSELVQAGPPEPEPPTAATRRSPARPGEKPVNGTRLSR